MILELVFLAFVKFSCAFEGFVVRGDKAQIEYFAHSVFLSIRDFGGAYVCGSSILNQKILLTAAHCFESCSASNVNAFVGNAHKSRGLKYRVSSFKIHENYDEDEIKNDIGLAVLERPLALGDNVKRVAILKSPPNKKLAIVAGWGLIDEEDGVRSSWLHSSNQKVWTLSECRRVLPGIPTGSLCAGDTTETSYASEGDSGSALIINDYIQVGLVSFKRPDTTRGLVVYSNVSYFYNWIKLEQAIWRIHSLPHMVLHANDYAL
ncbi:unnamed protein product [Pieris macdunnoughi]|uniref:Peptidase S1 domain-containing protein n=1 Tax=Pieris macdunnoughi TaxID=345717 RepID=A0A821NM58_9NEOP|nr:unnamed protein product [Pieris macdunnoughi]